VYRHLWIGETQSTTAQLLRYTVVGGVAFGVDFGSLYALTDGLHVHYLISAAIAFMLGLATNYALSVSWVFNRRTLANKWAEFSVFAGIGVVGLGLNEGFIWFFTETVRLHYLLSKIVSTFFVFLWNFFARKMTLFR
jgi:putative flippase GtrA